jgi:hypothetical protein
MFAHCCGDISPTAAQPLQDCRKIRNRSSGHGKRKRGDSATVAPTDFRFEFNGAY